MANPRHISLALQNNPDLAREIGLIVADYAALEWSLYQVFLMLSSMTPEETFSAYFSKRSINRKTALIEGEAWRLCEPMQVALKRLIRRMKGAAARRTEIAHVHMMQGGGGVMRLQLFGNEARMQPLDNNFINRTIDQFHTLATDLLTFEAIIFGVAPHILLPRIEAIYAPIDAALQRTPASLDQPMQPAGPPPADTRKRLGLRENEEITLQLHVEQKGDWGYFRM